jgi:hypothetical protein
LDI